jgi:hypothetical protein
MPAYMKNDNAERGKGENTAAFNTEDASVFTVLMACG